MVRIINVISESYLTLLVFLLSIPSQHILIAFETRILLTADWARTKGTAAKRAVREASLNIVGFE